MRKIMVAPPAGFSSGAIHDRWQLLYKALNEEFGFIHHKTNIIALDGRRDLRVASLSSDIDTIFALISPRFINSDAFLNSINKKVRLILYVIDLPI